MYAYRHLCMCVHTNAHLCVSECTHMYMHAAHIHMPVTHTHAYAHAHVTRCVCMFTHMHTHTGTHVHVSFCVCMCLDGGVYLCTRDSACRFVSLGTYVYICSHVLLLG